MDEIELSSVLRASARTPEALIPDVLDRLVEPDRFPASVATARADASMAALFLAPMAVPNLADRPRRARTWTP